MVRQLIRAVARHQSGHRDQATVALRQAGAFPDISEQHVIGVLSERRGNIAVRIAPSGSFTGTFIRHIATSLLILLDLIGPYSTLLSYFFIRRFSVLVSNFSGSLSVCVANVLSSQ